MVVAAETGFLEDAPDHDEPAKRQRTSASSGVETVQLPHPWEELWSVQYKIPYFWNPETGDSSWEKPSTPGG